MATKRQELIKDALPKGKKVEFDEVIEGDIISLDELKGKAKSELYKVKKAIKAILRNSDTPLGSELVTYYSQKKSFEDRIEAIDGIKAEYLS